MKTYVIHVSNANDRENHMRKQLQKKNLDFSFVNEGDINEIDTSVLNEYFVGNMAKVCNATSCAYKHILACKKVAEGSDDLALILEDDIRFYSNYAELYEIVDEVKRRNIKNFILSLEDSILRYVPRSERVKGVRVYPKKKGRLTGAYLIDKEGAGNLMQYVRKEKVGIPMDWFHNLCVSNHVINMYWSQPVIAVQGSLDGSIKSLIDSKRYGFSRILLFKTQRLYKKLLYQVR